MKTYEEARGDLDRVIIDLDIPDDTAEKLRWAHELAMTMDIDTFSVRYTDGSPDLPAWLRAVEASTPHLLRKPVKPDAAAKPAPTLPPSVQLTRRVTMTEAWQASARGDNSLMEAYEAQNPAKPQVVTKQKNFTELWMAARDGDKAAIDAINSHLINGSKF